MTGSVLARVQELGIAICDIELGWTKETPTVFDAIRRLLEPPPGKGKERIGFNESDPP